MSVDFEGNKNWCTEDLGIAITDTDDSYQIEVDKKKYYSVHIYLHLYSFKGKRQIN